MFLWDVWGTVLRVVRLKLGEQVDGRSDTIAGDTHICNPRGTQEYGGNAMETHWK